MGTKQLFINQSQKEAYNSSGIKQRTSNSQISVTKSNKDLKGKLNKIIKDRSPNEKVLDSLTTHLITDQMMTKQSSSLEKEKEIKNILSD